jgi:prolyl-tRNA editing enzyme YbaK/EbsC (Cys-tRNA(Pro) deacylase)
MWPEPVEHVAAFLRGANAHGRLEELPQGVDEPPGHRVRAAGFDCDGRPLVVLVPDRRHVDGARVAVRAGCRNLRVAEVPEFPFHGARTFVDRSLLSHRAVWLEAGSARHFVVLAPAQLLRLIRAETGVFVADD